MLMSSLFAHIIAFAHVYPVCSCLPRLLMLSRLLTFTPFAHVIAFARVIAVCSCYCVCSYYRRLLMLSPPAHGIAFAHIIAVCSCDRRLLMLSMVYQNPYCVDNY